MASSVEADVLDRVVAFIDNEAITLSEFRKTYSITTASVGNVTSAEVLNTMINRVLLIKEAKKLRLEAPDDETLISDYIDLKIRAFIRISESDIERFYKNNIEQFRGLRLSEVRDKIELYLREREVNSALRRHIETLKEGVYIKIVYLPE